MPALCACALAATTVACGREAPFDRRQLSFFVTLCGLLIMNGFGCNRMKHGIKLTGITPMAAIFQAST